MEAILQRVKEPFKQHRDVAIEFRVSVQLVGRLARDISKSPSKIDQLHEREKVDQDKREAIESAATEMLASNNPITSCR